MNEQRHAKQEGKLEWIEPTFEVLMDPEKGVSPYETTSFGYPFGPS